MNLFTTIILLVVIGLAGYYCINKIGTFFDESVKNVEEGNRPMVIHLGFDAPYLAEDFIKKMQKSDKRHHSMEVIVYSGTKDDIMNMLLAGELDYAILISAVNNLNIENVTCREVILTPSNLITSAANVRIEMANGSSIKAAAFWVPRWVNQEKEYFSDLIMKLG